MPEPRSAFADLEKRMRERPYFSGLLPDLRKKYACICFPTGEPTPFCPIHGKDQP
jgi:hypothetical protein